MRGRTSSALKKRFTAEKGFGFISQGGAPDVFVHYSAMATTGYRESQERQKVRFDLTQGPKGPQAENVTLACQGERPEAGQAGRYPHRPRTGNPSSLPRPPTTGLTCSRRAEFCGREGEPVRCRTSGPSRGES
ncbi:hypothetical protein ACE1SV_00690 [Streptomyces sennicomposti]